MQRFILRGNVQRFRDLLERATSDSEKARLQQLLEEAEEELTSGTDLWRRNCPHLGISDVLGSYLENELEQIVSETHAAYGSLQVYDHRGGALYLIAQINFPVAFSRGFARVARGDGTICADTLARGRNVLVSDIRDGQHPDLRDFSDSTGIRAVHSIRMLSPAGFVTGVFSTHHITVKSASEEEHRLYENCAHRGGLAVANHFGFS